MQIIAANRRGSPWRQALVLGLSLFALALGAQAQAPAGSDRSGSGPEVAAPGDLGTQTAANLPTDPRQAAGKTMDENLSIWSMFLQASPVVKIVMMILLFASIWNITILFEKSFVLRR